MSFLFYFPVFATSHYIMFAFIYTFAEKQVLNSVHFIAFWDVLLPVLHMPFKSILGIHFEWNKINDNIQEYSLIRPTKSE